VLSVLFSNKNWIFISALKVGTGHQHSHHAAISYPIIAVSGLTAPRQSRMDNYDYYMMAKRND